MPKPKTARADVELDLLDRMAQTMQTMGADAAEAERIVCALRREFGGETAYIARLSPLERQQRTQEILARFNGKNTRTLARTFGVTRGTILRIVKQARQDAPARGPLHKADRSTFPGNGTAAPIPSADA